MITIEPVVLIANYFGENPDKKSLSYVKLSEIKTYIESYFHEKGKYVFCDLSKESMQNDISNTWYFKREENDIIFLCKTESEMNSFYEDLFGIFNSSFDEEAQRIKHDLLKIIEEAVTI